MGNKSIGLRNGVPNPNLNRNAAFYEVEIRLRVTIGPHNITGYEFNYSMGNDAASGHLYAGVVRWNGPLNNFTGLGGPSGIPPPFKPGMFSAHPPSAVRSRNG